MVDQTEPEEFGGEKPNGQHVLDDVEFSASISLKLLEKKRQRLRCFEPVPGHVARQRQRAALCITIDNDQFSVLSQSVKKDLNVHKRIHVELMKAVEQNDVIEVLY